MAQTFGRLPSEILSPLVPELAHVVRPLDWYVFDVTATARLLELRQAADEAAAGGAPGAPYVGSEPETRDEARQRMRERVAGPSGRASTPGRLRTPPTVGATATAAGGGARPPGRAGAISIMGMDIAAEIPPWDPRYRG